MHMINIVGLYKPSTKRLFSVLLLAYCCL